MSSWISPFFPSLCDLLGLNFDEGSGASVRTATGEEIRIRIHKVKMRIGDHGFEARATFSENMQFLHERALKTPGGRDYAGFRVHCTATCWRVGSTHSPTRDQCTRSLKPQEKKEEASAI